MNVQSHDCNRTASTGVSGISAGSERAARNGVSAGFSLVELMVVIALIALLISLVQPNLTRARDAARETACKANQKQIYTGVFLFAMDNDERIPPGRHVGNRRWSPWTAVGGQEWNTFIWHLTAPYLDPLSDVWMCPGWSRNHEFRINDNDTTVIGTPRDPAAGRVPFTPNNAGSSYWYHVVHCCPPNEEQLRLRRLSLAAKPHEAHLLKCMPAQQAPFTAYDLTGPHQQGGSWNVLWLDGHISEENGVLSGNNRLYVNFVGNWSPQ